MTSAPVIAFRNWDAAIVRQGYSKAPLPWRNTARNVSLAPKALGTPPGAGASASRCS